MTDPGIRLARALRSLDGLSIGDAAATATAIAPACPSTLAWVTSAERRASAAAVSTRSCPWFHPARRGPASPRRPRWAATSTC
jgi:hypothetical protein